jgi:hypothetical protein
MTTRHFITIIPSKDHLATIKQFATNVLAQFA